VLVTVKLSDDAQVEKVRSAFAEFAADVEQE